VSGWEPLPQWLTQFLDANYLTQILLNPLSWLVNYVGMWFFMTIVYSVSVFAGFMHTKSAFGAAVVSLLFAPLGYVIPELQNLSVVALIFAGGAVVYEFMKRIT